jgi:uncharacterized protein (TIGR03083 family)
MGIDYHRAVDGLDAAYGSVGDLAAQLSRSDLLAFSRCHGWSVVDVLFHLLCDAQRALVAFATPTDRPADRDFVSYWTGFAAESGDPAPSAWWVRRSAAAFRDGAGVVALWQETAPAAVRAARRADPDGRITTQGHVLAVPDFMATLATEAVVHHLDMTVNLPGAVEPEPVALALAVATLDGLLAAERPAAWSETEFVLKGTGRTSLSQQDKATLGVASAAFPLLS